ncbi:MAG: glycosyltransferase family 4 protein [Gallionella sp.]|nr:glycosyltransferase family 4 protein [Gallionella sp.]
MKVIFSSRLFDGIAGGVERMAIAMMNDLTARGHSIELISLDRADATTFYPLDPAVEWHRIDIGDANHKASSQEVWTRLKIIRRIVLNARPDVAIGFQQGAFFSLAVATLGLGLPVVAAERNAPQRFDHLRDGHGRRFQFESFRLAKRVAIQLESYRKHYPRFVQRRIVTIPNPVLQQLQSAAPAGIPKSRKKLLCVARLSYQKNQDLLIRAFASLAGAFPDWDLILTGGGEDETKLKSLVENFGLENRVTFLGAVSDVGPLYLGSHLFCLSSRWEGFPNALAEAMAYGLPAVGFADCAGVNELIVPGETGLLAAAGSENLANVLAELMSDDDRRRRMGGAAKEAVVTFAPTEVFDRWEELFLNLAKHP